MDSCPLWGYAIHRMELTHAEHHIYYATYHLVWTPKYRHPVFKEPYRGVLKSIIVKAVYDYNIDIQDIEIPSDHVHALVSFPPPMSISTCMRVLKSVSARELFKRHPSIRAKYFWGGKLWSPSYYAETIGQRNEQAIQAYIRHQLDAESKLIERSRQLKLFP